MIELQLYHQIHKKSVSLCNPRPYLILPSCIPSPYSIPPHACPSQIHSTPWMPFPYSIPPHACPPLIQSQPMRALPLFYLTPCMPSPNSIPPHALPSPILSQPMHAIPNSIPAHALPLPIISQPTHAIPVFYFILFQATHSLLTPCHILKACFSFDICLCHFESTHTEYIISIYLLWQFGESLYHFITSECLLFSFTWTHHIHMNYTVNLHIYHIITTYIVYHYSPVDITHPSTHVHIRNNKLHIPIIVFFIKCSDYSAGKVNCYKHDLSWKYIIYRKS